MADNATGPTFHGPDPHPSQLATTLAAQLDGEVRGDAYTRQLFATDASLYREVPELVIFPRSKADIIEAVEICRDHQVPILPRGGGTSLAGQAVNAAVILDCSRHLTEVTDLDPGAQTATVEPGAILETLNTRAKEHDLRFAPDPAAGDRSTIGGAIANNSAGAHSLAYGPTDQYIAEVEVIFPDGTVATLGPTDVETIKAEAGDGDARSRLYAFVESLLEDHHALIEDAYPPLDRNVAGYNLEAVFDCDEINLARLIAGSEGTLGIILEATVKLVPEPASKGALLLAYDDFLTAMDEVETVLAYDPAAVESLDAPLLDMARSHPKFAGRTDVVPDSAEGVLLVDIFEESDEAVATTLETIATEVGPANGAAIDVRTTTDEVVRDQYWSLRKSALPLMLSETTDEKHAGFVEDAAIPPAHLSSFVESFKELLAEHDSFASFYGHAGPGVLHVRPLLDVTSTTGRETMRAIAEGAFELTMEHGGTISGEHGDGRSRTEFSKRQYPAGVVEQFQALKQAVDPEGRFNPGPIVGDVTVERDLRIGPDATATIPFEPALAWETDNGMRGMVDLCHGCGGCRTEQSTAGGIMCPTYRATDEEITSTRGRANLLREAIRGNLPQDTLFDDRFEAEVLDLCIGCKGCLHDCPSSVDMATLKAEMRHQRHQRSGPTRRERFFGTLPTIAKIGSLTAPLSNWMSQIPGAQALFARSLNLTSERSLPPFANTALTEWADGRLPSIAPREAEHRVILIPDAYTNYLEPSIGQATIELLEAAGVAVTVNDDLPPIGRAAYSHGFIERSRSYAGTIVEELEPAIEDGWSIVVPEPSAAAMIQADYRHLLGREAVAAVADSTHTPLGFLDTIEPSLEIDPTPQTFAVHDHCHQQSIGHGGTVARVFGRYDYDISTIDSGCCGMAGSFGYHREHYDLSESIGEILVDQVQSEAADVVLSSGPSCRTQLDHLAPELSVEHPIVQLAADIKP